MPEARTRLSIACSRADEARVTAIVAHLRALGAPLAIELLADRTPAAGGFLVPMLSSAFSRAPDLLALLEEAVAEEQSTGRTQIVPCLLEPATLPSSLNEKRSCDFSRGVHGGLQSLFAVLDRGAEVLACSLDAARPLRLDGGALRTQLEAALLLGGPRARLLFVLDADKLERELDPLWADHAARTRGTPRASAGAHAELLLRNAATCLGRAARAAQDSLGEGVPSAALLEELAARAGALILYDFFKLLRRELGAEALAGLKSLDGNAALAELDRLDSAGASAAELGSAASLSSAASLGLAAELFGCPPSALVEAELRARPPLAPARVRLPRAALQADTESIWQHGHAPPAREVLPDEWWRSVVPGLVHCFASRAAGRLQLLAPEIDAFGFSPADYESIEPAY